MNEAGVRGNIVVLCGGPGGEREVSLVSGAQAHGALARAGVAARLVEIPAHEPEAFLRALDCSLAVMMLHGDFGEDGVAQEILEARGIPFSGSGSAACRLSMDKTATKSVMRRLGVPTPKSVLLFSAEGAEEAVAAAGIGYPLFVKPNAKGSSVGASRVAGEADLRAAVALALGTGDFVLVEELVAGRELTLGWLDGEFLPLIEMAVDVSGSSFYDYHAKYASEKTRYICPAEVSADVAALIARQAGLLVGELGMRDVARVDVMLAGGAGDVPMFLEVNALPGFTSHSLLPMAAAAAGVTMEALCLSLVDTAARRGGSSPR